MEKDKKMMWWILVAGVIIVVIIVAVMMNSKNKSGTGATNTNQTQTPADGTPAVTPPGTGQSASNLAYNDALKKYGTNRIQIQNNCQTVPNTVTYKSGTQVMLDNRSSAAHTISFNGSKVTLAAQGFTVLTMTAAKYPTTVLMDCDTSQNVATVLIQK